MNFIDFPKSKSDVYLLKNSEFAWIKRDSILKLNDIRTVSINRILYKHTGNIEPTTDTYKEIEALVLKKYFAEFHYEFENDKKTIESLTEEKKAFEEKAASLESDKKQLEEEIERLKAELIERQKIEE